VNNAPVAVNDNTTTAEDTPGAVNVTTNDTDVDGTINVATVDLDPSTAGIQAAFSNAAGSWAVAATGNVTYTPLLNFNGAAIVNYTVNDNNGLASNAGTLTVTVTAVNDAPVAVNDNTTTPEDTPVTMNVTTNDTDVDGTIDAASVDLDPATAGKQITFTNPSGVWDVVPSGVVTYTPALNFNGAAAITYRVTDNNGLVSSTATLSISVTAGNDAPVAVNDNSVTVEDTPVTFNVTTNDTDIDGTINAASVDLDPATGGKQITFTNAGRRCNVYAASQF
jgi:CshA-type fibril repeat protein